MIFAFAKFSGGQVGFYDAKFSGGRVTFGARFSGGVVIFDRAKFSGGDVDFRGAGDWSFPPAFPWTDTPAAGVTLPRKD